MTDLKPENAVEDVEPGDVEPDELDSKGDEYVVSAPTRNTRTRPSALDLARAFD